MRELKFQLTRILSSEDRIADFENLTAKTRILIFQPVDEHEMD